MDTCSKQVNIDVGGARYRLIRTDILAIITVFDVDPSMWEVFFVVVFLYFFSFIFSGGRILSVYDGKNPGMNLTLTLFASLFSQIQK